MKNKVGKYLILTVGALILGSILTWGGYAAIRSITGLAVAQSSTKWNSLKDAAQGDNLTNGIGAFGLYGFDGTNFDRLTATAGVLDVNVANAALDVVGGGTEATALRVTIANDSTGLLSIDDNGGLISVDGSVTPADDFTNPTTAVDGNALSVEFDGTTWDRVRHSFTQETASINSNAAGTTIAMSATPMSKFTMIVDRTAGSTDTVEIDVECAINGIFVQIGTIISLANEPVLTSIDGTPCKELQYNVVDIGSGNTVTIQLLAVR